MALPDLESLPELAIGLRSLGSTCHGEVRIDLERFISRLPDDQRMVFILHDVEGMKHREISERLDIPEGTSKTHLSNARKRLRAMMAGQGEET